MLLRKSPLIFLTIRIIIAESKKSGINTAWTGKELGHSIKLVEPRIIACEAGLRGRVEEALKTVTGLKERPEIVEIGETPGCVLFPFLPLLLELQSWLSHVLTPILPSFHDRSSMNPPEMLYHYLHSTYLEQTTVNTPALSCSAQGQPDLPKPSS